MDYPGFNHATRHARGGYQMSLHQPAPLSNSTDGTVTEANLRHLKEQSRVIGSDLMAHWILEEDNKSLS